MSFNSYDWASRIKAVESEYWAARFAIDYWKKSVRNDPTLLQIANRTIQRQNIQLKALDISNASYQLEGTYIIRLFAEFETCMRLYWRMRVRETRPRAEELLRNLATRCHVPNDALAGVNDVREYRNSLVHERENAQASVAIDIARGYVCRFVSHLL